jgi:4-hydroxybenzoate polyprenyltransferase
MAVSHPSDAPAYAPPTPEASGSAAQARGAAALRYWLRLARPEQWVKNFFVLAPLLFSGKIVDTQAVVTALAAFLAFCALASGIYMWNDVVDASADRAHPTKRARPVAAGIITPFRAGLIGAVLVAGGIAAAFTITPRYGMIGVMYLVLNILYSRWLKHVVIVDVFVVASFFLLRLLGGSAAIGVHPSVWLLLCGGLLALYLGFAKRRHELLLLGAGSPDHRSVLSQYSPLFLDQMSVVLLSATIISYVMYTLTSETAVAVGSETLSYSTVFVLYGVFRYLFLVHKRNGGSPTETLLTDRPIIIAVVLWLLYCAWVIYRPI